jgi:hypothetical protein
MKHVVPIAIALSLTVLLAGVVMAQEEVARLSDTPDGPAMTQFPSDTTVVYAIFKWTDLEEERVRVRVYDNYGTILFDQIQTYTGSETEAMETTTTDGYFPDGRYVTNFYRGDGDKVYRTIIWDVGEPVARPAATPTTAPVAKAFGQVKNFALPAIAVLLIIFVIWALRRVLASR